MPEKTGQKGRIGLTNERELTERKIAVIGGDRRQVEAAKELASRGYEAAVWGFDDYEGTYGMATRCQKAEDAVNGSALVMLPLPCSLDGAHIALPLMGKSAPFSPLSYQQILNALSPGQLAAAGRPDAVFWRMAEERGVRLLDYEQEESLRVLNAIPTAEGALALAMQEMPITLHGAKALVIGFGRIGKTLSSRLLLLGSRVSAAARRQEERAWMRSIGIRAYDLCDLKEAVRDCDVIFNTVPVPFLSGDLLDAVPTEALILDLASRPGGVDFSAAREKKRHVIWALSLPGKTAPVTAGRYLAECIETLLKREEREGGK